MLSVFLEAFFHCDLSSVDALLIVFFPPVLKWLKSFLFIKNKVKGTSLHFIPMKKDYPI